MAKATALGLPPPPEPFEQPSGIEPTAPDVPTKFLLVQFWRDIFGKEVQSAATYSYLWMADQMGHVALGIILQFALTFVCQYVFGLSDAWSNGVALLVISAIVCFWEFRAYTVAAQNADAGIFPLDKKLLRDNAVIAAAYMVFGVLAGYAFHLTGWWGALVFLVAMALSIYFAPYWLRQKIIWQKAALPYLSRLADLYAPVPQEQAKAIQLLIDTHPAAPPWQQVIIAGPVGSGRTPMVTGLGTDLAFKRHKVRYISFDALLEIADQYEDGHSMPPVGSWGPKNIFYWPWFEAQALLIDDISPIVGTGMSNLGDRVFEQVLSEGLGRLRTELSNRHTVWVFALDEKDGEAACQSLLDRYATALQEFCNGQRPPIVVRLPLPTRQME